MKQNFARSWVYAGKQIIVMPFIWGYFQQKINVKILWKLEKTPFWVYLWPFLLILGQTGFFLLKIPFCHFFCLYIPIVKHNFWKKLCTHSPKNWLPTYVCTDGRTNKQEFVNSPFEGPRTNKQNLKIWVLLPDWVWRQW